MVGDRCQWEPPASIHTHAPAVRWRGAALSSVAGLDHANTSPGGSIVHAAPMMDARDGFAHRGIGAAARGAAHNCRLIFLKCISAAPSSASTLLIHDNRSPGAPIYHQAPLLDRWERDER